MDHLGRQPLITMPGTLSAVKVLLFDVSGAVVDRRGSIVGEGRQFGCVKKTDFDWAAFAGEDVDLARQPGTGA